MNEQQAIFFIGYILGSIIYIVLIKEKLKKLLENKNEYRNGELKQYTKSDLRHAYKQGRFDGNPVAQSMHKDIKSFSDFDQYFKRQY